MNLNTVLRKTETLFSENATALLTGIGVVGTVGTAVLTGRASFKAAKLLEEAHGRDIEGFEYAERPIQDKVKLTWRVYIPAVGMGVTTITSIIFANRISTKRAAALAMAYGISDKAFTEYKEKVVEYMGEKKEVTMRDKIAQDRVSKDPVEGREVIIVGNGDVLCYDALTGRYFLSTIESIKKAENTVNYEIIHHMGASLSSFYDEIGLPPTSFSDDLGWNTDNIIDVTYSATISSDGRPCIVIDFRIAPITGFSKLY